MTKNINDKEYTVAVIATDGMGQKLEYLIFDRGDSCDLLKLANGEKADDIFTEASTLQEAFCYFKADLEGFSKGDGEAPETYKLVAGYTGHEDSGYSLVELS